MNQRPDDKLLTEYISDEKENLIWSTAAISFSKEKNFQFFQFLFFFLFFFVFYPFVQISHEPVLTRHDSDCGL